MKLKEFVGSLYETILVLRIRSWIHPLIDILLAILVVSLAKEGDLALATGLVIVFRLFGSSFVFSFRAIFRKTHDELYEGYKKVKISNAYLILAAVFSLIMVIYISWFGGFYGVLTGIIGAAIGITYYWPKINFKENILFGPLLASIGERIIPFTFFLILVNIWTTLTFLFLISFFLIGLSEILTHHVSDISNDRKKNIKTLATSHRAMIDKIIITDNILLGVIFLIGFFVLDPIINFLFIVVGTISAAMPLRSAFFNYIKS